MIRKYHNHKLLTNPRYLEEELHNNPETPGRQAKQSNQLCPPIEMIARLEWTQSNAQQNIEQLQYPTMGVKMMDKKIMTCFALKMFILAFIIAL